MKKLLAAAAAALLVGGLAAAPAQANGSASIAENIEAMSTKERNADLATLLAAVKAADESVLASLGDCDAGPFTVFAPSDAAFAKLPAATLEAALADEALLTSILLYHVVEGEVRLSATDDGTELETLHGAALDIVVDGNERTVNGAEITKRNIKSCNGVIHVIDTVLMPPSTVPTTGGSTTTMALIAAGLTAAGALLVRTSRRRPLAA